MVGPTLYDIKSDPGQREYVADKFPDVVAELTRIYEDWWDSVSDKSDAYAPTVVDPSKQQSITLSAQGWHDNTIPYNQQHVRAGLTGTGFWPVHERKAGRYRIELRRWSRDLDLAIGAAMPAPDLPNGADTEFKLYLLKN